MNPYVMLKDGHARSTIDPAQTGLIYPQPDSHRHTECLTILHNVTQKVNPSIIVHGDCCIIVVIVTVASRGRVSLRVTGDMLATGECKWLVLAFLRSKVECIKHPHSHSTR